MCTMIDYYIIVKKNMTFTVVLYCGIIYNNNNNALTLPAQIESEI